ncbi:MAG TPA: hypothetical protein VMT70_24605 [Vicinamibacteria bacterium]|nr:hypothetical protein [Vicinamibacteria bacterium]
MALALALLGAVGSPLLAQGPPRVQHLADVKELPGTVVAQARVDPPETVLGIAGYRIRHVALPEAHRVLIQGKAVDVAEGWHVTVRFARPLAVRDQAFSLVIDGRWCGFLQEAPDLRSADAVCFDASLIHEGAALGVTYRSIQIVSSAEDERLLGPDAIFADSDEAIHYASWRLRLRESR